MTVYTRTARHRASQLNSAINLCRSVEFDSAWRTLPGIKNVPVIMRIKSTDTVKISYYRIDETGKISTHFIL
ncbi:hypothetical protein, partial [Escherichia coli]|uniref:hypothetical protein n=1 Tax=Escherichia coli TaxID=562 RepID=UPI001BDBCEDB